MDGEASGVLPPGVTIAPCAELASVHDNYGSGGFSNVGSPAVLATKWATPATVLATFLRLPNARTSGPATGGWESSHKQLTEADTPLY